MQVQPCCQRRSQGLWTNLCRVPSRIHEAATQCCGGAFSVPCYCERSWDAQSHDGPIPAPVRVKGILFGTYCSSINEIKMTKYWRTHLSYVDRLWDYVKGHKSFGTDDQFVPQPFYQYKSVGEYNGILLKPRLLRKLFLQVLPAPP